MSTPSVTSVDPDEVASRSGFPGLEGERREVTVLFADLVGSTSIGERIGDEATYALTKRVFTALVAIVEGHGGRLAEFSGDGIMALFGGPVPVDDAALVACRTALEIHQTLARGSITAVRGEQRPLRIRTGITTGLAIVGEIGLPSKIDLTAIGDSVNLAARLQGLAEADQILIDHRTYALVAAVVDVIAMGEQAVRGRTSRAKVYRLLRVNGRLSRFGARPQASLLRMAGRVADSKASTAITMPVARPESALASRGTRHWQVAPC